MITRNQRSILFSLGLFSGAVVFGVFVFTPIIKNVEESSRQVTKVNEDREKVLNMTISIPQMQQEQIQLEKDLLLLEKRLPMEDQVSVVIGQISEKTADLNMNVLSISSGDQKEVQGKAVMARSTFMDLVTDFKTLSSYLELIEEVPTALAIKKVFVSKRNTVLSPQLSVRVQVETYMAKPK